MKYYLEKRDEKFDEKMAEILCVYKGIEIQNEKMKGGERIEVITLSIDEKPGIQAIKNIAEDTTPKLCVRRSIHRDYEYKRLGTVIILAALDLHTGEIIGQVHNRHRNIEFIELLKEIDSKYQSVIKIRIILDNHIVFIYRKRRRNIYCLFQIDLYMFILLSIVLG